jgi:molybdenum cofactor cytidylyltransferase
MGSPKALLPFRGGTFLGHLLSITGGSAAQAAGIGTPRVVLGSHAEEIAAALGLNSEIVVINPAWEQGQLSSIQAAIRSLPQDGAAGIMLFLVDHPLISAALVERLAAEFFSTGNSIVLPTYRGKRGHPVIFAQRLFGELLAAPAERGARAVVWAHASEVREVVTDEEGVVLNLNGPAALRRALE